MILRIKENNKIKEIKFEVFDIFYNSFRRFVNEINHGDLEIFKIYNFDSPIIRERFLNFFNNTEITSIRKLRYQVSVKSDKCIQNVFWTDRGWTEEYAQQKIQEIQKNNSRKFTEKFKDDPTIRYIPNQIQYWKNKGYSDEESVKKVSECQHRFSLQKLEEKYGKEKALELLKKRNDKWIKSLKSKYTDEEMMQWKINGSFCSKESINLFKPFAEKYKDYYPHYGVKHEYGIRSSDGQYYLYDFVLYKLRLIFEYQGEHVHPNPNWDKDKWNNWEQVFNHKSADEVLDAYNKKIQTAEIAGFTVVQLWNSTPKYENEKIIESKILSKIQSLQQ